MMMIQVKYLQQKLFAQTSKHPLLLFPFFPCNSSSFYNTHNIITVCSSHAQTQAQRQSKLVSPFISFSYNRSFLLLGNLVVCVDKREKTTIKKMNRVYCV